VITFGKVGYDMNTSSIIKVIKSELKTQGITYLQVAKHLKISEAGVKKLFGKDDLTLSKLNSLSQIINTPVMEVLKRAESDEVDIFTFDQKDIQFFLRSPHYFHFFMKLAYEQSSPKKIQEEFNLSNKSLMLYLKKLEDMGLIKRHPHDRTQILGGIPLAIKTTVTDLERIKYDIALGILERMKKRIDPNLKGAGLFLSAEEVQDFVEKVFSVVLEYSEKSRSNRRKKKIKFQEYTFMSFLNPESMFNQIIEMS
jgi:hypothetical protein